jgi:hypothetical protein
VSDPLPPVPELLRIQLRTLYRFDRLGRLKAMTSDAERVAPRIVVVSGGGQRLVRTRNDIPESACRAWLACESDDVLRDRVARQAPIETEYRGPAYVLPPVEPPSDVVHVNLGVPLHPELLARGWKPIERGPYVAVVRDGLAVSLCFSAAECGEAAEAGVETATAYRGRGLVVEAVRGWAAAVQASGRLALYSTTWENEASQRVAEKLGAFEYGEDWHLT